MEAAVRAGCQCVVLSDKGAMEAGSPPIPPLLATGAVHHHLIRQGGCRRLPPTRWLLPIGCLHLAAIACLHPAAAN